MIEPTAWIVTPTLEWARGERTVTEAARTAGVPTLTYVAVDKGRKGGVKTANRALKATEAVETPFVCYINDDVSFPQRNWLRMLIEVLESNPRYGLVGPSGNCSTDQQKGRLGDAYGIQTMRRELSFFCVVFRREVLDKVGYLDERFIHYACDNDHCIRAKQAGWEVIWARHVFVQHNRSRTIRDWKTHDLAAFNAKWPEHAR
jgi:GT2 family glycosyltransferase